MQDFPVKILEIRNLSKYFYFSRNRVLRAVDEVTFDIRSATKEQRNIYKAFDVEVPV